MAAPNCYVSEVGYYRVRVWEYAPRIVNGKRAGNAGEGILREKEVMGYSNLVEEWNSERITVIQCVSNVKANGDGWDDLGGKGKVWLVEEERPMVSVPLPEIPVKQVRVLRFGAMASALPLRWRFERAKNIDKRGAIFFQYTG
nr:hypothetical protein Iba_chr04aCG17540 [Ipomoea batatas]